MSAPRVPPAAVARDRLRIAVQRSGRLAGPARALLAACGLVWREAEDQLFWPGREQPVDLLRVRDDDIPGLIAAGHCDLGIVGRNVLLERQGSAPRPPAVREWRALGFGRCRLAVAVPAAWTWRGPADLAGRRIATSYPGLLAAWLRAEKVPAEIVTLAGSVEIAPQLGQADAVCDLVSSGATLAAHGLVPVADLLASEAVLAGPRAPLAPAPARLAATLLRRVDGILRHRACRLVLLQVERERLAGLLDLLPDAEAPTVMQVDGADRLALQALCRGELTWQRREELERAGAHGLLVLPVEGVPA